MADWVSLYRFTVLPASAVPSIVSALSFVNVVVVVITGATGGVVSTVIFNALDAAEIFPDASVDVTVKS